MYIIRTYYIFVPINDEAKDEFYHYGLTPENKEKALVLELNEEELNYLWDKGLFEMISIAADIIIDVYEEEWLEDLEKMKTALSELEKSEKYNDLLSEKVKNLFREAIERKTAIDFTF